MSLNLATILEDSRARYADRTAVILDDVRLTYAQIDQYANRVASALVGLGVQPGDKVALMMPNVPQFVFCYYGILKTGAVVVPLNVLFKDNEVRYHLEDSDAVALIAWHGFGTEAIPAGLAVETCRTVIVAGATGDPVSGTQRLEDLMTTASASFTMEWRNSDDTAVILYTSGTTGRPKGAELTHANMLLNADVCSRNIDVRADDVALIVLPLFHSFGQTCVMNTGMFNGSTLTLVPRFDAAKVARVIERDRVTVFNGVPTMYFYLLNDPAVGHADFSSLRYCGSGGSAVPVDVLHAFEKRFGVAIVEGYGLSETSPVACFNPYNGIRKVGSVGVPVWATRMDVHDDQDQPVPDGELGEIVIKGHCVMRGYYKKPEATAEAMRGGWFHSGDIGRRDADGYFYIVDRKKDMILRGGFNIYPRELEEVLYAHPAIAEAAVVGVPHLALGEEVAAVVSLKPGQSVTPDEIIAYCKEQMAAYKYPRTVEILETLPKTATGKILKRELRSRIPA